MILPHPIRFERLQNDEKAYRRAGLTWVPFESFCSYFFEPLPGKKTFLDYRSSILGQMPRSGISSTDVGYACWRKPRIYIIEKGIGELLINTRLGDIVTLEHFNLPFRTIYLHLPKSQFEVSYRPQSGGVKAGPLEGVYVIEDDVTELNPEDAIVGLGNDYQDYLGIPVKPVTVILVSERVAGNPDNPGLEKDDCLFSLPMFFKDGPILPQIDKRMDEFLSRKKSEGAVDHTVLKNNIDQFREIFEWVVNIILYITMPKSRVDRGKGNRGIPIKKLEKNKKKRRNLPDKEVFIVGRGIKISHLHDKGSGLSREGKKGIKRRAHWVSGHYRKVPYGPMKIDGIKIPAEQRPTRIRWILPFPRGEGSDYFRNVFRVTE